MKAHTETSTLQQLVAKGVKLTPMMEQYYAIKQQYHDTIVLFRMGDFYEVFFEDAQLTSKLLNITLTHRGKLGDIPIPMAGIPHHAAPAYVDRMTNQGYKIAICEQVQDPKDAVGIVKRAVTQVVSPGLPYDLDQTESREPHYIACSMKANDEKNNTSFYLLLLDFTTGSFLAFHQQHWDAFLDKLQLFHPREFITFMGQWEAHPELDRVLDHIGCLKTHLSQEYFETKYTNIFTEKTVPGYKRDKVLKFHPELIDAIGALSYYVCTTQQLEALPHLRPIKLESDDQHMKISAQTLVGLEILPRSRETYRESLLGFMDKTKSSMGARFLRQLFLSPLKDHKLINQRYDTISALTQRMDLIEQLRLELEQVRDIERIMAKVSTQKASPSDLLNLAYSIKAYQNIFELLSEKLSVKELKTIPTLNEEQRQGLLKLAKDLQATLNDEIGASLEKGNLIKAGRSKERDRLAKLDRHANDGLEELENKYRTQTGIQKLKVKFNNVAGYFIEISKSHTEKIPKMFERRQTLVNCERYTTPELKKFELEVLSAKEKLNALEREIFKACIQQVADEREALLSLSHTLSFIDSIQSLAWVSLQENFQRPDLSADKKRIYLDGVWHPLIKSSLKDQFVPHDLCLDANCFFGLITGPNMAGKTTVMREVAITQLLAQIGCFVPAYAAQLGICDYVFSRLGASDDILRGQSTFMVEMSETAEIIRHASDRSLIILDEVGRGTSTYDGLSIAWALVEYLINNTKALTLFATHYHELIEVIDKVGEAKNLTVETINHNGEVQFLYRLIEQAAAQSFGLHVAKLAGLPRSILHRAQELLSNLEKPKTLDVEPELQAKDASLKAQQEPVFYPNNGTQLSFLMENSGPQIPDRYLQMEQFLEQIEVFETTPMEALRLLNELKHVANGIKGNNKSNPALPTKRKQKVTANKRSLDLQ